MRPATVYTRTGKGVLAIKKKAAKLPRDVHTVFLALDGKATVADLLPRLGLEASHIEQALVSLEKEGYIKVFTQSTRNAGAGDEAELDFTKTGSLEAVRDEAPADSTIVDFNKRAANRKRPAKSATRQEFDALLIADARPVQAKSSGPRPVPASPEGRTGGNDNAAKEKAAREREEALRSQAEAQARVAAEQTQAKAHTASEQRIRTEERTRAEAEAKAQRAVVEARLKAAQEELERVKQAGAGHAELAARLEAERRARTEVEAKLKTEQRAREDAARALAEARKAGPDERTRVDAHAHGRADTEQRLAAVEAQLKATEEALELAKEAASSRGKRHDELQTDIEAERRARASAEAKAQAAAQAREQAEQQLAILERAHAETRLRGEEEARARAEAEAKRGTLETQLKTTGDELERAKETAYRHVERSAAADARADEESKARANAEAKARAESEAREEAEAKARAESEARSGIEQQLAALKTATDEERSRLELRARAHADAEAKLGTLEAQLKEAQEAVDRAKEAAYRHAERRAAIEVQMEEERQARENAETRSNEDRQARDEAVEALLNIKKTLGLWQEPERPDGKAE